MNEIMNLTPMLENGSITLEVATIEGMGRAWSEIEIFNEQELQETANLISEYANNGVLVEWTVL